MTVYNPPAAHAAALSHVTFSYGRAARRAGSGTGSGTGGSTGSTTATDPRNGASAQDAAVLRNLSLDIPAGTVTALLGPNGVGKTTLLNLLLGWLTPSSGSIRLFGRPIATTSRREMGRTVSLVPQDEHIPFEYTLLDYVLLGRAPHLAPLQAPQRGDMEHAYKALEQVGMGTKATHPVSEISGGEKQLAMVARSLAQRPRLLLMDEPTAHLDLHNKRRSVDLVHQLRDGGTTVILTTHDPDFASAAADRLVLLHEGRVLAQGSVDEVMTTDNMQRLFSIPVSVTSLKGRHLIIW